MELGGRLSSVRHLEYEEGSPGSIILLKAGEAVLQSRAL